MSDRNRLSVMYLSGIVGIVAVIVGVIALFGALAANPSAWNITFWCGAVASTAFGLAALIDPAKQFFRRPGSVAWLLVGVALFVVSYLVLHQ